MKAPGPAYYLVHSETGQRYSIRDSVTIGRTQGDIVFATDFKLSPRHCMVTPSQNGLVVVDLQSDTGTTVEGAIATSGQALLLRPNQTLAVGSQLFTLQSFSLAMPVKKPVRKRRKKIGESYLMLYFVLVAALAAILWHFKGVERTPPLMQTQAQLANIYDIYQDLLVSVERQTVPPAEVAKRIQGRVLEPLSLLARRWSDWMPADHDQRNWLNVQMEFASALTGHARAQADYLGTGQISLLDEIDRWNEQLEQASSDMHHLPPEEVGQAFPSFIQSPLLIVEKEMRLSIRAYKRLIDQVKNHALSDKQMAEAIHKILLPQMNAVYSRMGAIVPQNEFERRRVVQEQKLVTGFLGKLKSTGLFADTKDPKYARDMERWTADIEKTYDDLKSQTFPARHPAVSKRQNK